MSAVAVHKLLVVARSFLHVAHSHVSCELGNEAWFSFGIDVSIQYE